jgi:hypothetical protein
LEQGQPINASVDVLDAVGRALRLDPAEWQHLYHLAGLPSPPPVEDPVAVDQSTREVLSAIEGLPAAAYSSRYDVLAWNACYAGLFPTLVQATPPYRNVLWNVFTTSPGESPWINRSSGLPEMVATLRAAYGRHVGDPTWVQFLDQLGLASDEFARMWSAHDVLPLRSHTKRFQHPEVGELTMGTSSYPIYGTPEARLVVYTPLDELSRQRMRQLRKLVNADEAMPVDRGASGRGR